MPGMAVQAVVGACSGRGVSLTDRTAPFDLANHTQNDAVQATLSCIVVPSSASKGSHMMVHLLSSPTGKTAPLPGAYTTERALAFLPCLQPQSPSALCQLDPVAIRVCCLPQLPYGCCDACALPQQQRTCACVQVHVCMQSPSGVASRPA